MALLRPAAAGLALAFLACASSCSGPEAPPAPPQGGGEPTAVRALDELPTEQLRVVLKGFPGDWRNDTPQSQGAPPPPAQKAVPPGARRIDLVPPAGFDFAEASLREAIATRRSVREFSAEPLSLAQLSFLLWATQGVTGSQLDGDGQVVQTFRASPSGGARYPLETYLVVQHVESLPAGLYRYLAADHQLVGVRESADISSELQAACYGQAFVGDAAVAFIWAAIPERSEWKYAYLAPRLIAIEAGHVCQNLYLAAGAIDAGCCALLSYDQSSTDRLLGVDGTDEFAIYLACLGNRVK